MRIGGSLRGLGILAGGFLLLIPCHVHATAIADSNITFSNLIITPSVGTLQLLRPWEVQAFAQASNSLGEFDDEFNSSLGDTVEANAAVTHANGHGDASAPPSILPDLSVKASADSHGNIPGMIEAQAQSLGRGTVLNSLLITGGVGRVSVDFSVDLADNLSVFTDQFGVKAETETIFSMELDGTPLLFHRDQLLCGTLCFRTVAFSENLSASRILQFDTTYSFLIEVDSESEVINTGIPEPGTWALLLTGLGALPWLVRKQRT